MSLRQRLADAGGRAAAAGAAARDALGDRLPSGPDEQAIQAWLAGVAMPQAPATQPWTMSVGALLGRTGSIPPFATKALGLLDRFGRISVGPQGLGIDGDDLAWHTVTSVRTAPAATLLSENVVTAELNRVKGLLPPMPGRSLVLAQVGTVLRALLSRALPDDAAGGRHVVASVDTTGRLGRQRTVDLGLAAALVLMAMPEVDRSIRATAEQHGVPVMGSPSLGGQPMSAASFRQMVQDDLGGESVASDSPSSS